MDNAAMDLSDIVVIELASVLAGPMAGMFFAELGATVHKIENARTGGDMTRRWRLKEGDDDPISAYYASVNYGKEVHLLDLTQVEDLNQLRQLVKQADIVISNYNDAVSTKLQVSYDDLRAITPDIIYAQLYAYSPEDPRPGFDLVMQAETGFMYMNGHPDGPPAKMPVALIDVMAAHQIKEAILLGLYNRALNGQGSYWRISLYESAIAALANQASNYLMAGHIPQRMGTLHPNIAPYGDVFTTSDGQNIMLAIGSDKQWNKLRKVLNFANAKEDPFKTNEERVSNRRKVYQMLGTLISAQKYSSLKDSLTSNAIPFCKLMTMQEVFSNPLSRRMILEELTPKGQVTKRVRTTAFHIAYRI